MTPLYIFLRPSRLQRVLGLVCGQHRRLLYPGRPVGARSPHKPGGFARPCRKRNRVPCSSGAP